MASYSALAWATGKYPLKPRDERYYWIEYSSLDSFTTCEHQLEKSVIVLVHAVDRSKSKYHEAQGS